MMNTMLPPKPKTQTWAQKLLSSGGHLQEPLRTIASNASATQLITPTNAQTKYVPPSLIGARSGSQGGYDSSLKRRMLAM